ncbi:MAG: diadenylate cyclase [Candidatus Pacearchaeota archaeon]|nr:diadenylate cyclase [Candidatus Pacearchaeota archaeon]
MKNNKVKTTEISSKKKMKQIEEKILSISVALARKGEGALFIIGDRVDYTLLVKQRIEKFNLFDLGADKLLKSIASMDGCVIIDRKGNVLAYGAMVKKTRPFVGYGTRHAAAFTASMKGNTSILCSEEEHKVKIFKNGKLIMQIDGLQKNVEKDIPKITSILESLGAGVVGTIGVVALAPALGVALIPGVIIFGAGYYAIKNIIKRVKKFD